MMQVNCGALLPFGSACGASSECCSGRCVDNAGQACTGPGAGCICGEQAGCTPEAGTCSSDTECCNGLCSMGHCADIGGCDTHGQTCSSQGFNGSCCSTVCLDTGSGPQCQFLGGCRVQDDLCTSDADCCSGACRQSGMATDGRPILRCANVQSCLPVGEVCGGQGASSNCCPNGGGDMGCEPTGAGFRRCFGGGSMCVLAGDTCPGPMGETCCGLPPGLQCVDNDMNATTPNVCCLPDGVSCAFSSLCCNGQCVPDSTGALHCGSTCVNEGGACSAGADCCNGCCSINGICDQTACNCLQLGALCGAGLPPCCNACGTTGGNVACTGLEFQTCAIVTTCP
jgi:hypothetical protein